MSLYAPDSFGYLPQAEAYFLGLTQVGVMLSARDLELLRGWRDAGVPIETVCRGMRAAFDAFDSAPRSIHHCRKFVTVEIEAWRARSAGTRAEETSSGSGPRLRKLRDPTRVQEAAPEPEKEREPVVMPAVWHRSLAQLVAAGKAATDDRVKAAYRAAWKAMQALGEDEENLGAVALAIGEVEAEFFDEVMKALTDAERHELDSGLAPRMVSALRSMSADARAAQLRVWRRPGLADLGALPFFAP